jgi:general secretion pathway protein L
MEKLAIRLGSSLEEAIHWLVWSDAESEIIASGELPNAAALSQLTERAPKAEVIALVPGCDVVLKTVTLPAKANRKVLGAIPFMLEDEVASDISKSFFAFGKRVGDLQQVAVVNHDKMRQWQESLESAGLFCTKMVPDILALPYVENTTSVLALEQTPNTNLLIRNNEWLGLQGESTWLYPVFEKQLSQNPCAVTAYSELAQAKQISTLLGASTSANSESEDKTEAETTSTEGDNDTESSENANGEVGFESDFSKLPMQLLLEGALASAFTLLQGDYAVKRKTNETWQKWRVAAVLAAVALCVNLVSKTIELNSIKKERIVVEQQLQAAIQQGFPGLRARDKRSAIKKEMTKLENGGGGISMLVMLSQMSESFANTGVKPQSIRFDATRTELRMQSVANNFDSLEKFRRDVQALGFEVDQGAINNKGDQVVGTIVIKG